MARPLEFNRAAPSNQQHRFYDRLESHKMHQGDPGNQYNPQQPQPQLDASGITPFHYQSNNQMGPGDENKDAAYPQGQQQPTASWVGDSVGSDIYQPNTDQNQQGRSLEPSHQILSSQGIDSYGEDNNTKNSFQFQNGSQNGQSGVQGQHQMQSGLSKSKNRLPQPPGQQLNQQYYQSPHEDTPPSTSYSNALKDPEDLKWEQWNFERKFDQSPNPDPKSLNPTNQNSKFWKSEPPHSIAAGIINQNNQNHTLNNSSGAQKQNPYTSQYKDTNMAISRAWSPKAFQANPERLEDQFGRSSGIQKEENYYHHLDPDYHEKKNRMNVILSQVSNHLVNIHQSSGSQLKTPGNAPPAPESLQNNSLLGVDNDGFDSFKESKQVLDIELTEPYQTRERNRQLKEEKQRERESQLSGRFGVSGLQDGAPQPPTGAGLNNSSQNYPQPPQNYPQYEMDNTYNQSFSGSNKKSFDRMNRSERRQSLNRSTIDSAYLENLRVYSQEGGSVGLSGTNSHQQPQTTKKTHFARSHQNQPYPQNTQNPGYSGQLQPSNGVVTQMGGRDGLGNSTQLNFAQKSLSVWQVTPQAGGGGFGDSGQGYPHQSGNQFEIGNDYLEAYHHIYSVDGGNGAQTQQPGSYSASQGFQNQPIQTNVHYFQPSG